MPSVEINEKWPIDAIIYQIFPDRFFNGDTNNDPEIVEPWGNPPTRKNFFGGDLKGIIERLWKKGDRMKEIGLF